MNTLSEFILDYRKKNAMTQTDLANVLGVTEVTISNIENGKIKAGYRTLKAIALNLEIDIVEVARLNENNKQV